MANFSTAGRPPKPRLRRLGRCRELAATTSASRRRKDATTTHLSLRIYLVHRSPSAPFPERPQLRGWVRLRTFRGNEGKVRPLFRGSRKDSETAWLRATGVGSRQTASNHLPSLLGPRRVWPFKAASMEVRFWSPPGRPKPNELRNMNERFFK